MRLDYGYLITAWNMAIKAHIDITSETIFNGKFPRDILLCTTVTTPSVATTHLPRVLYLKKQMKCAGRYILIVARL